MPRRADRTNGERDVDVMRPPPWSLVRRTACLAGLDIRRPGITLSSSPLPGSAEFRARYLRERGSADAASARIRLIRRRYLLLAGVPAGPRIEPGEPGSLVGDVHDLRT